MNIACMLRNLQKKTLFHHTKWRDIFAYLNDFNNSFTSRFKHKLFEVFKFWKNDRFIILNVKYLQHSKIFANVCRNSLRRFRVSSLSISVACASAMKFSTSTTFEYTFMNESSRSHSLSIEKKKSINRFEAKLKENEK